VWADEKLLFNRVQSLNERIPTSIAHSATPLHDGIRSNFMLIASDLQCLNTYRYARSITGGIQEYMEAMTFKHYLESQTLISYDVAGKQLNEMGGVNQPLVLSPEDYILGIFDMTGELMKFGITSMATSGSLPGSARTNLAEFHISSIEAGHLQSPSMRSGRDVLHDLRELRSHFEALNYGSDYHFVKEVDGKMAVMCTSVEKVEKALYGLIIRGSERPKGWLPSPDDGRGREEIETY